MIYGTPAASLGWGTYGTSGNRAAGAAGEVLTGQVLNGFADRAAVFHDLAVPGRRINADHAVLSGNRLLIIDSKVWPGGKHWSFGDWYFHGLKRTRRPSKAVAMARDSFRDYLRPYGVKVVTPLVVLWSGSQATGRHPWVDKRGQVIGAWGREEARPFLHLHYPGGKAIPGNDLSRRVHHFTHSTPFTRVPPNPGAIDALRHLLH